MESQGGIIGRVSFSWKPAFEYSPPNQGKKEDSKALDGVCGDTSYNDKATEKAEDDGIEGPRPVRPIRTVFAATKDEYSEDSKEEEEVLRYAYSTLSI